MQANRPKLIRYLFYLCLLSIIGTVSTKRCSAQSNASADFARDVQPIFQARCILCHGSEVQMGGLRLDQRQSLLKGGKSGIPAIVPGKSAQSLLVRYISGLDPKLVMPPTGERLSAEEISLISQWIDQGAVWPDEDADFKASRLMHLRTTGHSSGSTLRLFRPSRTPPGCEIPLTALSWRSSKPESWTPSPAAEPRALLRRIYLDVIGMPPSLAEQEAFLQSPTPAALDRVVS